MTRITALLGALHRRVGAARGRQSRRRSLRRRQGRARAMLAAHRQSRDVGFLCFNNNENSNKT